MMTRWTPFDLVNRTDREFDDLVRRTFGEFGSRLARQSATWAPPLDIFTKEGEVHVRLELPGIDPENDVDIEVTDGMLRIHGERRRETETDEQGYWRRELSYGQFERQILLPDGVDAEQIHATYDAGILDISVPLPKKPTSKVKVEVGSGNRKQLKQ